MLSFFFLERVFFVILLGLGSCRMGWRADWIGGGRSGE